MKKNYASDGTEVPSISTHSSQYNPENPRVLRISGINGLQEDSDRQNFKILFVEAGRGNYCVGDREISISSGSFVLIPPNTTFRIENLNNVEIWMVYFGANELFSSTSLVEGIQLEVYRNHLRKFEGEENSIGWHIQANVNAYSLWIFRLNLLDRELGKNAVGSIEIVQAIVMQMVVSILKKACSCDESLLQSNPLIDSVFLFIKNNYRRQISLSDVAAHVAHSPAYLTNFVRQYTGKTVLNWIIEYRMQEARHLLSTSRRSVEEIAESLGYLNTSYFIRQFRRINQETPHVWRAKHRERSCRS